MKGIYCLDIVGDKTKQLLEIGKISIPISAIPIMSKLPRKQRGSVVIGSGGVYLGSITSMYWLAKKEGGKMLFIKPRYRYNYEEKTTIALYNIESGVWYDVCDFGDRYKIALIDGRIEKRNVQ